MRLNILTIFLLMTHLASTASTTTVIQCVPELEVNWSLNQLSNSSEFFENSKNLSNLSIQIDSGFVKVPDQDNPENSLFRQVAIERSDKDPLNFTVRYENNMKLGIKKTSLIIVDPMCYENVALRASIFETTEASYTNTIYGCECLSPVFDSSKFIFSK